ncbi:hypothetical protein Fcan01_26014 [Folsomia candida]|uniref:F-box domain-containing protein n=1 Tax=Folsomia candida TaxID=158441 RepID=A0A226D0Z0_FOLCA|nr:hypothetical protein Fcan01_26014 [Folsomia candida]
MPNGGGGDGSGDSPPWEKLPTELVVKILGYLPRADLLSSRLVSKAFVPHVICVRVWISHFSKSLAVGLWLLGKSVHEFEQDHTFKNLDVVPDWILEKIAVLSVDCGHPDFVRDETFYKNLATLQAKAHNLLGIFGTSLHFDNFAWIIDMISRNKGLYKIELEQEYLTDEEVEDGKMHKNLRYVDCNWMTGCQNLRDVAILFYENKNLAKLPPSLTDLTLMESPVTLENVVWISENQRELRNCIIAVREEVADESLLRHMALIGKPGNAYELVGLSAPTAESDPPATNALPTQKPTPRVERSLRQNARISRVFRLAKTRLARPPVKSGQKWLLTTYKNRWQMVKSGQKWLKCKNGAFCDKE